MLIRETVLGFHREDFFEVVAVHRDQLRLTDDVKHDVVFATIVWIEGRSFPVLVSRFCCNITEVPILRCQQGGQVGIDCCPTVNL